MIFFFLYFYNLGSGLQILDEEVLNSISSRTNLETVLILLGLSILTSNSLFWCSNWKSLLWDQVTNVTRYIVSGTLSYYLPPIIPRRPKRLNSSLRFLFKFLDWKCRSVCKRLFTLLCNNVFIIIRCLFYINIRRNESY